MKNRDLKARKGPETPLPAAHKSRRRFVAVLAGIASAGVGVAARAATPGEVPVGAQLRDVTMTGLTVPYRRLSDFRGKPLIINVWASWCGPCRAEMGSLERLSRLKGGQAFTVIGISTDDYPEAALAFVQKTRTSFAHFIDQRLVLESMLGANRLPLTVLVDAEGRVVDKIVGAREWDSADAVRLVSKAFRLPL